MKNISQDYVIIGTIDDKIDKSIRNIRKYKKKDYELTNLTEVIGLNKFYFRLDFHVDWLYEMVVKGLIRFQEFDLVQELNIEAMRRNANSPFPMLYYTYVDTIIASKDNGINLSKYTEDGAILFALADKYPEYIKELEPIIKNHIFDGMYPFPQISALFMTSLAGKKFPKLAPDGTNSSLRICQILREGYKYLQ